MRVVWSRETGFSKSDGFSSDSRVKGLPSAGGYSSSGRSDSPPAN